MVVETVNWKPGRNADLAEVLADERMERYVKDWGRRGDGGIIAERDGQPVGALWWRYHTAAEPAYGYVADVVPEKAIDMTEAARRNFKPPRDLPRTNASITTSLRCAI